MTWLDFITIPALVYGLAAGVGLVAFGLLVWSLGQAAGHADRMLEEGDNE